MVTAKEIADRLSKVVEELEQIDIDIMYNFPDSKESVLMFLRGTVRDTSSIIHKASFYTESLLKLR